MQSIDCVSSGFDARRTFLAYEAYIEMCLLKLFDSKKCNDMYTSSRNFVLQLCYDVTQLHGKHDQGY